MRLAAVALIAIYGWIMCENVQAGVMLAVQCVSEALPLAPWSDECREYSRDTTPAPVTTNIFEKRNISHQNKTVRSMFLVSTAFCHLSSKHYCCNYIALRQKCLHLVGKF